MWLYVSAPPPARHFRWTPWLPWLGLTVAAVWVRGAGLHSGLLYPDGYDYLLMARGIAAHLQPTLQLGPAGMLFSPPLDAAIKPVFPALTALLSVLLPLRSSADVLTVAGGAATVVLTGLVSLRLTGSQLAGLSAGIFALVSPALGFWSGFSGPDALAPALALATVLLALSEHPVAAGVTGALCAATRPEWMLAAGLVAASAAARPSTRTAAANALIAGAFTLAAILGILRPPLGTHLSLHSAASAGAVFTSSAVGTLLGDDWPLLALAAAGLVVATRRGLGRPAFVLLCTIALLTLAYLTKNPGSERYLSQLVPLLCVAAGIAVSALSVRLGVVTGVLVAAALLGLTVAEPSLGHDPFAPVAARLRALRPVTVVTAAPEAYGYLLPGQRIELMKAGGRGVVVLDGAQRAYAPGLSATGRTLYSVSLKDGFERPDGTLDYEPARIVRGVVTVRTG